MNKIIGAAILIMLISFPLCPLHTNPELRKAAGNGNISTVELMLRLGANPNAKRHDGITALMRASNRGHTQTVRTTGPTQPAPPPQQPQATDNSS